MLIHYKRNFSVSLKLHLVLKLDSVMKRSFVPPKSPWHSFNPVHAPSWNKKIVPLDKLKTVPKRKAPVSDELAQTRKKKKNVYAPIMGIPYQPDTPPRITSTSSWNQSSIADKRKEDKQITEPCSKNWWDVFLTGEGEYERRKRAENNRQKEEQSSKSKSLNSNHSTNSGRTAVEVVANKPKEPSYFETPKPKSKKKIPLSPQTPPKQVLYFEKPKPKSKKQIPSSPQTPPKQSLNFQKPGPKSKKQIPSSPQTPPKQSLNFQKPGPKSKKQILSSSPRREKQRVYQPSSSRAVDRSAPTKYYVFHFPDGSTAIQKRKIVA